MKNRDPRSERFIMNLRRKYQHDRGSRAALRGALSRSRRDLAWPLLGNVLNDEKNLRKYEIVAALWAAGRRGPMGFCFGAAARYLATEHKSFDKRFRRVLTCDHNEVSEQVARIVQILHQKRMGLDYMQLLSDLLWWNDHVRIRWAAAYWGENEQSTSAGVEQ